MQAIDTDILSSRLIGALPPGLNDYATLLARVIADVASGVLTPSQGQLQLGQEYLASLARTGLNIKAGVTVTLEMNNGVLYIKLLNEAGETPATLVVRQSGATPVESAQLTVSTGGGDYAGGYIDKREGMFVGQGSIIHGDIVGHNTNIEVYLTLQPDEDLLQREAYIQQLADVQARLKSLHKELTRRRSAGKPDVPSDSLVYEIELAERQIADLEALAGLQASDTPATLASKRPQKLSRCDFYEHVSLPVNFIPRPGILLQIRQLLTNAQKVSEQASSSGRRPLALHGMPGIGKSVIARALCDDPEIQESFSDGILWVTLGQQPDIAARLREWLIILGEQALGDAPTAPLLVNALRRQLKSRSCLIIIDDVWSRGHAEAFVVGGPHCRVVFTTRDAEIGHSLGAAIIPVPLMDDEEARTLLGEWADGRLAEVPVELTRKVAERVGHLPLALRIAGAQLRVRDPRSWLEGFAVRTLEATCGETPRDNFKTTIELSLTPLPRETRQLYVALAIFRDEEGTPAVAVQRLWNGLQQLSVDRTLTTLEDLAARALLDISDAPGPRRIRLHDLVRELLQEEPGEQSAETHRALIHAYQQPEGGARWSDYADDGYLHQHLVFHLSAAGLHGELAALFADNNWLSVRGREHIEHGLEDLRRTWEHMAALAHTSTSVDERLQAFRQALRCTVLAGVTGSVPRGITPTEIRRAVEFSIWSPTKGLQTAFRFGDTERRVNTLLALLKTSKLSEEQCAIVVDHILDVIGSLSPSEAPTVEGNMGSGQERSDWLSELLPFVPVTRESAVLDLVRRCPHYIQYSETGWYHVRPYLLARLARSCSEQFLPALQTCLETIKETADQRLLRPEKLAADDIPVLIEFLKRDSARRDEILHRLFEVMNVQGSNWSAQDPLDTLSTLVPLLTSSEYEQLYPNIVRIIQRMERWAYSPKQSLEGEALLQLLPLLKGKRLQQLVRQALGRYGIKQRLGFLAVILREGQPASVDELTQLIVYRTSTDYLPFLAITCLGALREEMPPDEFQDLVRTAQRAASSIRDGPARVQALVTLLPLLASAKQTAACRAALQATIIRAELPHHRNALERLLPHLDSRQKQQMISRCLDRAIVDKRPFRLRRLRTSSCAPHALHRPRNHSIHPCSQRLARWSFCTHP